MEEMGELLDVSVSAISSYFSGIIIILSAFFSFFSVFPLSLHLSCSFYPALSYLLCSHSLIPTVYLYPIECNRRVLRSTFYILRSDSIAWVGSKSLNDLNRPNALNGVERCFYIPLLFSISPRLTRSDTRAYELSSMYDRTNPKSIYRFEFEFTLSILCSMFDFVHSFLFLFLRCISLFSRFRSCL